MNITVHIERLVLDGLPLTSHEGHLVGAAMEAEITRLLANQGIVPLPRASAAVPHARTGSISLGHNLLPTELGREIAGAVHKSIGSTDVSPRTASPNSQSSGAGR